MDYESSIVSLSNSKVYYAYMVYHRFQFLQFICTFPHPLQKHCKKQFWYDCTHDCFNMLVVWCFLPIHMNISKTQYKKDLDTLMYTITPLFCSVLPSVESIADSYPRLGPAGGTREAQSTQEGK